jgi:hypothetical protein
MKWKLTRNQYHAILVVLDNLLKGVQNSPLSSFKVLYESILSEANLKAGIGFFKLKQSDKKDEMFRLTKIQTVTFWILMSDILASGKMKDNTSLEFAVATQLCRDIHQKILT